MILSIPDELLSNFWQLLFQQFRYRNRPNLKRPLPLHFNRARMLAVCEPVYPPAPKNCLKDEMTEKKVDNVVAVGQYTV